MYWFYNSHTKRLKHCHCAHKTVFKVSLWHHWWCHGAWCITCTTTHPHQYTCIIFFVWRQPLVKMSGQTSQEIYEYTINTHYHPFKTLRPSQDGCHFAGNIFKYNFSNENVWILIKILLKFVLKGPIHNIPALDQIMAWRQAIGWTNDG